MNRKIKQREPLYEKYYTTNSNGALENQDHKVQKLLTRVSEPPMQKQSMTSRRAETIDSSLAKFPNIHRLTVGSLLELLANKAH